MNDQQRITEAYELVQEWAPAGVGTRLKTWAKGKAWGALGPLARGSQRRIQGQKEFQTEINKLKVDLQRYLGKIDVSESEVTGDVLAGYLKSKGQQTPTVNTLEDGTNVDSTLSDDDINNFIIQSYKEKSQSKKGSLAAPAAPPTAAPAAPPTAAPAAPPTAAPAAPLVPDPDINKWAPPVSALATKQAVDQKRVATSIAKSLKNKPLTPGNLLNALAARGLELTNR